MNIADAKPGELLTRKSFLSKALIVWSSPLLLPLLYVIIRYIIPPTLREKVMAVMNLGKISEVPVDSARIVKFNKTPVILVRNSEGQIKAFSAVCTHLGCIVEYRSDDKNFHCNCHGSVFDVNGKNIGGPAPRPLQPYRVELKEDNIIVSKL